MGNDKNDLGMYMSGGIRRIRKLALKGKFDDTEYRNLLLRELINMRSFQDWVYDTLEDMQADVDRLKRDRTIMMVRLAPQAAPSISTDSPSPTSQIPELHQCTVKNMHDSHVQNDTVQNMTTGTNAAPAATAEKNGMLWDLGAKLVTDNMRIPEQSTVPSGKEHKSAGCTSACRFSHTVRDEPEPSTK